MRGCLIVIVALLGTGCAAVQDAVVERQMAAAQQMLAQPGEDFEQVRGPLYSFRYGWYRNLVLVGEDAIAVVDPTSDEAAARLAKVLAQRFPDKRIDLLIYSHSHHDHLRGGAKLRERFAESVRVLSHRNLVRELDLLGEEGGVLRPTEVYEGDHAFVWQGLRIELLHLPRSHSDAYLAVWLPQHRVVYAPDLVAKKGGLALENDNFLPGVIQGQNRLLGLDADLFVPGHFGLCTRADLVAYRDMLAGMREIVADELGRQDGYDVTHWDAAAFTRIQQRLRERYGHIEGFNEALVTNAYYLVLGYVGGF